MCAGRISVNCTYVPPKLSDWNLSSCGKSTYHDEVPIATAPAAGFALGFAQTNNRRLHGAEVRMTDHYSMILIAWMFFLLIGAWVLVNALIDLGARRVGRWVADRWHEQSHSVSRIANRHRANH